MNSDNEAQVAAPAAREHGGSLGTRLALSHIAAVFLGFTVCSVLLYFKLLNQLDRSDRFELQAETASITALLRATNGVEILKQGIYARHYEEGGHGIFVRVIDGQGGIYLESADMAHRLPMKEFPPPEAKTATRYRSRGGAPYLLRTVREPVPQLKGWQLQIAYDVCGSEKLAATYRNNLALFTVGGLLFALVSSAAVVRRGLKPLNELSDTIREVSDSRLNTRMDPLRFPVEMHSLVESFNSMMSRLDDSFQRLSHCSANLAHELRTPINSMMLEAEIALSKERSAGEYREVLVSCLEECQHLSGIVERLLFMARADGKHHDMWLQKLDMQEEAEEILDYFYEEAERAGVKLVSTAQGVVYADRTLLRRAVSNLVSNAIAYTPYGGQISISTGTVADGSVEVVVCDTGRGIAQEHLPLLFDRFYRVCGTDGGKSGGTGLGLAIVKAIMLMHRGEVSIWSEPGKGTIVTLRFNPSPS